MPVRKDGPNPRPRHEPFGSAATACQVSVQSTIPTPEVPFENCRASTSIFVLPSYKEPTVDALAPRTDEGRE